MMGNNELYCPCCKQIKSKTSFYRSLQNSKDYYPYCRNCVTSKFDISFEKNESDRAALWSVCMQMGLPFMQEVYDVVLEKIKISENRGDSVNLFVLYYNTFRELGILYTDVADSDLWYKEIEIPQEEPSEEIIVEEVVPEETTVKEVQDEMEVDERRAEWDRVWGEQYEDKDCKILDDYFAQYTKDIFDLEEDTAMVLRYRDLAKAELRRFLGDNSKESTDEILKLMKLLKIDQFQENKRSDVEKFIDRWAWKIENTRPAECEDLNKYKDYAQNESMWMDIMRTLRNAIAGTRDYPQLEKEK